MLQLKDDTARCEEDEAEKKVKLKAMREHHHKWEDTREGRVGTWRDFVKGKKTRVCLADFRYFQYFRYHVCVAVPFVACQAVPVRGSHSMQTTPQHLVSLIMCSVSSSQTCSLSQQ